MVNREDIDHSNEVESQDNDGVNFHREGLS